MDAIGALVSSIFLGLVLTSMQYLIGMPLNNLYVLAGIAVFFLCYSSVCFLGVQSNWKPFLAGIAMMNFLYSILTLSLMVIHYNEMTLLGLSYFIIEIIILWIVVGIEYKAISALSQAKH